MVLLQGTSTGDAGRGSEVLVDVDELQVEEDKDENRDTSFVLLMTKTYNQEMMHD